MKKLQLFIFVLSALMVSGEEEAFFHLGKSFRVFRAQPEEVRMVWADEEASPLLSFKAAYQELAKEGKKVMMLTNGGIFEPQQIPSGLYVERGKVKGVLNLQRGQGNFFLRPNAVFFLCKEGEKYRAGIVESEALAGWTAAEKGKIWYAVQSGPALLLDGQRHPSFNRPSKSELLRSGVGVTEKGEVIFVITKGATKVNLWSFADCFRALGCRDALFLDGVISRMEVKPAAEVPGRGFATMFGIVR